MKKFELKVEELEVVEEMDASDTIQRVTGVITMVGLVAFGVTLT